MPNALNMSLKDTAINADKQARPTVNPILKAKLFLNAFSTLAYASPF